MTKLIEYRQPGSWEINGVRFLKGPNYVEDNAWEEIKKHPLTQVRLDEGVLLERGNPRVIVSPKAQSQELIIPPPAQTEPKAESTSLPSLNVVDATELINRTDSLEQLQEWDSIETRRTVKRAIAERINSLGAKDNASVGG